MFNKVLYIVLIYLLIVNAMATLAQVSDSSQYQKTDIEFDTIFIPADTIRYVDTVFIYYEDTLTKKVNWQVEFFFSPSFFSDKTDFTNVENKEYGQLFEKSHFPELSYTYGANLNLMYKKMLLQSGINYTQFNEGFDYKSPLYFSYDTSVYMKTDTLDTYYIVEGTDTSWFYITEENEYAEIDTIQNQYLFTSKNSYSYFEFPVIIGYLINRNNFSFLPKAGVIIGVLNQTKGKAIDSDNYQDIVDLNDSYMLTSIPLSMYISLDIQYRFSEKAALFLEPYYRQQINSVYRSDFPIRRKIRAYGVKIGVTLKI